MPTEKTVTNPQKNQHTNNELTHCFIKRKWSGGNIPLLPPLFKRTEKKEKRKKKKEKKRAELILNDEN
ncbi:hypothetical protein ACH42_14650 [Endozoicomonas sp. (ex Bugula neritina AB1)]|nr:hypothetical protein ACH42_14650 [Endozoicomonas sp. (ex Bugula neritina AB1)]